MTFDIIASLIMIPFLFIIYILANIIRFYVPYAWIATILLHILAWVAQAIGHYFCEPKPKSLADSSKRIFLMHPFFTFIEALFFFGYRRKMYNETMDIISEYEPIQV